MSISRGKDLPRFIQTQNKKKQTSDVKNFQELDVSRLHNMALIDIGTDQWIREHECCDKLYMKIVNELSDRDALKPNTTQYNSLSGTVRVHLKQLESELDQLQSLLNSTFTLTYEEKERRQRLIEDLQRKKGHLMRLYRTSLDYQNPSSSRAWFSGEDDEPLLDADTSTDGLKRKQTQILAEQDEGLERLADIISRQKTIAITIGNEVDSQNDIIDDIGNRMESTNTRIHSESRSVTGLTKSDSYGYWMIIIILLCAIIGVAMI